MNKITSTLLIIVDQLIPQIYDVLLFRLSIVLRSGGAENLVTTMQTFEDTSSVA